MLTTLQNNTPDPSSQGVVSLCFHWKAKPTSFHLLHYGPSGPSLQPGSPPLTISLAVALPMPLFAPVTRKDLPATSPPHQLDWSAWKQTHSWFWINQLPVRNKSTSKETQRRIEKHLPSQLSVCETPPLSPLPFISMGQVRYSARDTKEWRSNNWRCFAFHKPPPKRWQSWGLWALADKVLRSARSGRARHALIKNT